MILTDTHSHIYLKQFDNDREEAIKRSIDAGVSRIFLPNIDLKSIAMMNHLSDKFPKNCFPMMGLHPCSVEETFEKDLDHMHEELLSGKYCAVGEIGIDLYWDKTTLGIQQKAFRKQIQWAKEMNLPIVIHARESFDEIFAMLDEENDEKLFGIFHCFTGNEEQARRVLDYGGFKLGIGGVLTFKNAGLDKTVKALSIHDLVLETDTPYLAPHPFRGKRNESSYTLLVAEKLASIFELSLEEVARITTENSRKIFGF